MALKEQAVKPIMMDAGIKARTGKGWDAWFAALDKAGASKLDFYAKGGGKARIALQVNRLAGPEAVESERATWKKAMERLADCLKA